MSDSTGRVRLERTYDATIDEVWRLWTTREGIESWWGPEGFAVTVKVLELRPGGRLDYVMTAVGAGQVAFMKQAGMPVAHDAHIVFREVVEARRLVYTHVADFIPGVAPYDVETVVELEPVPEGVRLVLTFDRMHDEMWTERARMGWESELGKLARALGA